MKKVLALALALCMVFAMSAVAFAANEVIEKDTEPQTGTVIVKTYFDEEKDPSDYDSYTVTIPADVIIEWGAASAEVGAVTVEYAIGVANQLQVSAAYDDGADAVVSSLAGTTTSPVYTDNAETVTTLTDLVVNVSEWGGAPTDGMQIGQVNYTVAYTAAA